jgi:glyoxylase-like metal-dependent hydrolase (beta-lactamase superfamily II)
MAWTRIELPTPYAVGPVNVWVHVGESVVLVDAGASTRTSFDLLELGLMKAGVAWRDVDALLLTHGHLDHFGMGRRIRDVTRARVHAHAEERDFLERYPTSLREMSQLFGAASRGHGFPSAAYDAVARHYGDSVESGESVPVDVEVRDGEQLAFGRLTLEVVHTPGHTSGATCFIDRSTGTLLSGDTVLESITPVSFFRAAPSWRTGPGNALSSLAKLKGVEVRRALPGHGEEFAAFGAAVARIEGAIRSRRERVLEAARAGGTAHEIAQKAFTKESMEDRWLAFAETLGLLELLEGEGSVVRDATRTPATWRT